MARHLRSARVVVGLLVASVALAGSASVPAVADDRSRPAHHPARLRHVGDAAQVVVVTTSSWRATSGRLRAYERRADGGWRRVLGPVRAHVGRRGFAPAASRTQGSLTTPAGTFGLLRAFGTRPDPGTALSYRRVREDWWPYDPRDPATYNVEQPRRSTASRWRTSWAEDLTSYGRQYRHAVVVDFNLPGGVVRRGEQMVATRPADTRRGGGIFLHVRKRAPLQRPTAGCVAVRQAALRALLGWLDPTQAPVVVMGPRPALPRL